MKPRWPLFVALLPLLLGLAVYGGLWRGWAAEYETTLARWFPGTAASVSGFPYRLEAELADVALPHDGAVQLGFAAARLRLNRGPWRPELTVLQGQGIRLNAALGGLAPHVAAAAGTASLKLDAGRLARLSIMLPASSGSFGLGPDFTAESLELHAREMLGLKDAAADPRSPRLPAQGQLVIGATGLRLGQGAAISLDGEAQVRGGARLTDYQRWAGSGSIDVTLAGRDATGELFALTATLVPVGQQLRLAGTIATVCPLAVQAALNGSVPPAEQRLRAPVRLTLETALPAGGPVAISGVPADLATRPRRGQLPACPRLG
jgi:hypothetical protein